MECKKINCEANRNKNRQIRLILCGAVMDEVKREVSGLKVIAKTALITFFKIPYFLDLLIIKSNNCKIKKNNEVPAFHECHVIN